MAPSEKDTDAEAARARLAGLAGGYGSEHSAGGLYALMARFPMPTTDGLPPKEAEAVLARWRAEIHAYLDARESPTMPVPAISPDPRPTPVPVP